MLESTTGRNAYYGMYSELQVKLTSLHIKLILKFIRRDLVVKNIKDLQRYILKAIQVKP